ncbi:hypothetical protein JXA32_16240 [Candidatus Sumerlaeota bacterium]|nr:hypothetical protein [Candidatus Sumerlaeota bacterium]
MNLTMFRAKRDSLNVILTLAAAGMVYLLMCPFATAGVNNISKVQFPRTALVKGACLEFENPNYVMERIASYDLLLGASLYPEYWLGNEQRMKAFNTQAQKVYMNNENTAIMAFLFFPYKVWGVDPQAPPDIWLRDMEGNAISGEPGTYYLNYAKASAVDYIIKTQVQYIKDAHWFEGVYLDRFALKCSLPRDVKVDVNGDGKADSKAELDAIWNKAAARLIDELRTALGDEALICVDTKEMLPEAMRQKINGIVYHGSFDPQMLASDMEDRIAEINDLTKGFKEPNVHVVVQSASDDLIESVVDLPWQELIYGKRQQWLVRAESDFPRVKIGLAASLLTGTYYAYELGRKWPGEIWWFDEYNSPLGLPLSDPVQIEGGIFQRVFQGGRILVNTTAEKYEIALDMPHHDMTIHTEGKWFIIEPSDMKILSSKLREAREFKFLELPREDISLYTKEATYPWRPLPPGVQSITVGSMRDGTRDGTVKLYDGSIEDPSLWVSDIGMPQSVNIEFEHPTFIKQLIVYPAGSKIRHQIYEYQVKVHRGGEVWEDVASEENNEATDKIVVPVNRDNIRRLVFRASKTGDNRLYLRELKWE